MIYRMGLKRISTGRMSDWALSVNSHSCLERSLSAAKRTLFDTGAECIGMHTNCATPTKARKALRSLENS
jgi:hypothetical protein